MDSVSTVIGVTVVCTDFRQFDLFDAPADGKDQQRIRSLSNASIQMPFSPSSVA